MKLIVGLGNPGEEFQRTPHNVGFVIVESVASKLALEGWSRKFKGLFIKGSYRGNAFILLKPLTFMNLSGEAVVACLRFFKIELNEMLVVSDDIDLPAGRLRYRKAGGHGGHNGLRSIIQLTGDNRFHRLRFGVGRPDHQSDLTHFLLKNPSKELDKIIEEGIQFAVGHVLDFLQNKPINIAPAAPLNKESDN